MVTATANDEPKIKGYGARIQQPVLPDIGTPVVFFPRVGEGAGRQDRYPAMIKNVDLNGDATIMVFYAADDIREVVVPKRDEQNQRGWDWLTRAAEPEPPVNLSDEIADLRARIDALEKAKAAPKAAKAKTSRR